MPFSAARQTSNQLFTPRSYLPRNYSPYPEGREDAMNQFVLDRRPTVTLTQIRAQAEKLPRLADLQLRPWEINVMTIVGSFWMAASLLALSQPLAFVFVSPDAWNLFSAAIGVVGALVSAWLVQTIQARVAKRAQDTTASTELLRQTIDWAVKERQELYQESEKAFQVIVRMKDQVITDKDREIAALQAEIQRLLDGPPK